MYTVYLFSNKDEIIYVGKTKRDIKQRMNEHFGPYGHLPTECYNEAEKIEYYTFLTAEEMDLAEAYLIRLHNPKYNTKREYLSCVDRQYIKKKIINKQTYKEREIWHQSLDKKQKQKHVLNRMYSKLKSILKSSI